MGFSPRRRRPLSYEADSKVFVLPLGSFQSYRDFYRIYLLRGRKKRARTGRPAVVSSTQLLLPSGYESMNTKLALSAIVAALMLTACAKQEAAGTDTTAAPPAPAAPAAAPAAPAEQAAPAAGTAAPPAGEAAAPAAGTAAPPAGEAAAPAEKPKQ